MTVAPPSKLSVGDADDSTIITGVRAQGRQGRFAFSVAPAYAGPQPVFTSVTYRGKPPMLRRAPLVALFITVAGFLFAPPASAQRSGTLKPAVFAVRDARVVVEPGKVLPRATVVIRDGIINAVGPDVKPPADA